MRKNVQLSDAVCPHQRHATKAAAGWRLETVKGRKMNELAIGSLFGDRYRAVARHAAAA